jgi:nicotinamidase-related amidase
MSPFERAALLLIDWQEGMHDPKWGPRNNPEAEDKAERLLATWRRLDWPIYHVQHISNEPNSVFRAERPGSALMRFAVPRRGEPLIQKQVNSAFIGTDLERQLRSLGLDTLVLTGMQSDHCVSTTARMAGNLGFTVYLVEDATATFERVGYDGKVHRAEDVHSNNLASLHGEFATVVTTSRVLDAVVGSEVGSRG